MEYYFVNRKNVDEVNNFLYVDDFEFTHLTKSLRKKVGNRITFTDGERNIYECEIVEVEKDKIKCKILKKEFNLSEPEVNLSLYVSSLRNNSRFEFLIEKAVELGVHSIHPIVTEFAQNKNSFSQQKMKRFEKIIVSAMCQSQRAYLPKLFNTISFDEMLEQTKNKKLKIVMYEFAHFDDQKDSGNKFKTDEVEKEIELLIGPEGGFSKKEIEILKENNWKVCSLGERKLRAETAAIVSVYKLLSNSANTF